MLQRRKRCSVTTVDNQDTLLGNAKQLAGPVHPHLDLNEEKFGLAQTGMTFECMTTAEPILTTCHFYQWETCSSCSGTAAQITVINRVFADTFTPPLIHGEKVTMKVAGNSDYIEANYCKDTRISIGDMKENPVKWTVLIADIFDPVIFGLDFFLFI